MKNRHVAILTLVAFIIAFSGVAAYAVDLSDALKLFGIAYAVRAFSPQLNTFVNSLLGQRGVQYEGTTKVVPIISIGSGTYVGAAQVAGSPNTVRDTKAVGQGEANIGDLRGQLLIPMDSLNPLRGVSRVEGVGVTAVIEFRI